MASVGLFFSLCSGGSPGWVGRGETFRANGWTVDLQVWLHVCPCPSSWAFLCLGLRQRSQRWRKTCAHRALVIYETLSTCWGPSQRDLARGKGQKWKGRKLGSAAWLMGKHRCGSHHSRFNLDIDPSLIGLQKVGVGALIPPLLGALWRHQS